MNDKLPPLPKPDFTRVIRQPYPFGDDFIPYFSAAQMKEYARLDAPVQVAPAGWKLVPINATAEMLEAAWAYHGSSAYQNARGPDKETDAECYSAMLAAAVMPTPAAADDATTKPEPTYSSTQATNCADCGKHKHTPLRIDAMGGYVCLTCIDQKLGSLLEEFGYPVLEAATALRALVEAVRLFRNEKGLERAIGLRATDGYTGMCDAWEQARDFLEADVGAAADDARDAIERVYEPATKLTHYVGNHAVGNVTACGITDWIGQKSGTPTKRKVNCNGCISVAKQFGYKEPT